MRVPEGKVTILTLLLNPDDRPCDFRLPTPHLPARVLLDSAEPEARERAVDGETRCAVAAHSAVLLYAEHARMSIVRPRLPFGANLAGGRTHAVSPVGAGAGRP